MGFSNNQGSAKTFASMKVLKEGEAPVPFFIVKEKVNNEWIEKSRFKQLAATPIDIDLGSYKWKDDDVDTVKLQLQDGEEKIQLEFNLDNGLSRSILNSLLGEALIGNIELSLYVNKDGFPSVSIKNDGQKTTWKYPFEAFPVVEKTKKGAVIDNTDYIAFLKDMVKDIKVKLSGQPAPVITPANNATKTPNQNFENEGNGVPPPGPDETDDLPF